MVFIESWLSHRVSSFIQEEHGTFGTRTHMRYALLDSDINMHLRTIKNFKEREIYHNEQALKDLENKRNEFENATAALSISAIDEEHFHGYLREYFFYLELMPFFKRRNARLKGKRFPTVKKQHVISDSYSQ